MNFLAPLFLAGLAAVAIPILVHLTHREKKEPIRFPSLMFLNRVPFRTVRRQRIRHWLLFALRVAAIALIVAAFARPLVDSSALGIAVVGEARDVVVALDRSFSMAHGDRWDRAREQASDVIDALGPNDRITVVAFADKAEVVTNAAADRAAVRASVGRLQVGGGRTRVAPALQLAHDLLEASELPRRELVLITDFQRSAWEGADVPRMPAGTVVRSIDVGTSDAANVAVADVVVDRSQGAARDRVRVAARIVNMGSEALAGYGVSLELENETAQTQTLAIPRRGAAVATFTAQLAADRQVVGRVRLRADDMTVDDVFHFHIARVTPIRVLILTHPAARANELLYVEQALSVGTAPPHEVTSKNVTQLREADLTGMQLVLLADAPAPQGAAGQALERWVAEGGGLLVVWGPRSDPGAWTSSGRSLVGAQPGAVIDRMDDRGATLGILSYTHPIFEPFALPRSGDFSVARFLRYRSVDAPAASSTDLRVLARFDDGTPALAERRVGEGRVVVWTAGISNQWNDLPLKPVFLPFVHQLTRYLASYRPAPNAHMVGQIVTVPRERVGAAEDAELVIETPRGDRRAVSQQADVVVAFDEAGVYRVRRLADRTDGGVVFAANMDPEEGDLTPADAAEVILAVHPDQQAANRAASLVAGITPGEKERRQALWWYLLIAAGLLLLAESVLAHRAGGLAG